MNKMNTVLKIKLIIAMLFGLCGCSYSNSDMSDLDEYIQNTINKEPGPIEPLPEFVAYDAYSYGATALRDPFNIPVIIKSSIRHSSQIKVQPNENREKEFLEQFSIGSLIMVGSMARNNETWALLKDEEGGINRVTTGSYLGRNHGRIISAGIDHINIVEVVPDGMGGWKERAQIITLVAEL